METPRVSSLAAGRGFGVDVTETHEIAEVHEMGIEVAIVSAAETSFAALQSRRRTRPFLTQKLSEPASRPHRAVSAAIRS